MGLSGPVPKTVGMLTLGPSGGVALGNLWGDLFAPTPQECTVPSGPPGFLHRESAQHSMLLVPCGDTFCLTVRGRRLAARACCHTPVPESPSQREARLFRQRREATPASPPSLPLTILLPRALLECDRSRGQGMSQQQEYTL